MQCNTKIIYGRYSRVHPEGIRERMLTTTPIEELLQMPISESAKREKLKIISLPPVDTTLLAPRSSIPSKYHGRYRSYQIDYDTKSPFRTALKIRKPFNYERHQHINSVPRFNVRVNGTIQLDIYLSKSTRLRPLFFIPNSNGEFGTRFLNNPSIFKSQTLNVTLPSA